MTKRHYDNGNRWYKIKSSKSLNGAHFFKFRCMLPKQAYSLKSSKKLLTMKSKGIQVCAVSR